MEKQITLNNEYNTLEKLLNYVQKESPFEASIDYDSWDVRTDSNGQMEKCLLLKKGKMHGLKMQFVNENELKMSYVIPNKLMNAYFGKSVKQRQNILEILTEGIKKVLLSNSQQTAFDEMSQVIQKIA